jgi:tetratricopeptide (TPR) repeat protein
MKLYDKIIQEINRDDSEAWYIKGLILERLGQHEQAISCLDETIRLAPNDRIRREGIGSGYAQATKADGFFIKADILHQLGEHEEALNCIKQASILRQNEGLTR